MLFSLKAFLVLEKKIFKHFFTIYGHSRHLVQYPFNRRPPVKSGEIAQTVSEKKTFENYTILDMYVALWQEQITPRGHNVDCN